MDRRELKQQLKELIGTIQREQEPGQRFPDDLEQTLSDLARNARFIQEDGIADGVESLVSAGTAASNSWLEELFSLQELVASVPGSRVPLGPGVHIDLEGDLDEIQQIDIEGQSVLGDAVARDEEVYVARFETKDEDGTLLDWMESEFLVIRYQQNHASDRFTYLFSAEKRHSVPELMKRAPVLPTRLRKVGTDLLLLPSQRYGLAAELATLPVSLDIRDIELLRLYVDELAATTDVPWLRSFVDQLSIIMSRMFRESIQELMRHVDEEIRRRNENPKSIIRIAIEGADFTLSSAVSAIVRTLLVEILSGAAGSHVPDGIDLKLRIAEDGSRLALVIENDRSDPLPAGIVELKASAYIGSTIERARTALGGEIRFMPEDEPHVLLRMMLAPDPRLVSVLVIERASKTYAIPMAPIERIFSVSTNDVHTDTFGKPLIRFGRMYLPVFDIAGTVTRSESLKEKTCLVFHRIAGPTAMIADSVVGSEFGLRDIHDTNVVVISKSGQRLPLVIPE